MDDDSADGLEIGYQFVKFYQTYTDGKEFINAIWWNYKIKVSIF